MRQPDTDRRWLRPPSLLGPKGLTGRFPLPSSLPRIIFGEHHLIRSPWPFGRVVLGSQCLVYRRLALGFGNLPRGYRIQPDLVKYPSDGRGTRNDRNVRAYCRNSAWRSFLLSLVAF